MADRDPLAEPLATLQRVLRLQTVIEAIAAGIAAAGLAALLGGSAPVCAALALSGFGLVLLFREWALKRRGIGKAQLAEHLNRRFPELEESAQVLLATAPGLAALQRRRVEAVLPACLEQRARWLPKPRTRPALLTLLAGLLLLVQGDELRQRLADWVHREPAATGVADGDASPGGTTITDIEITVRPPAYTGLAPERFETLDLAVPEGATVSWRFRANPPGEYALRLGDAPPLPLVREADGTLVASARIDRSSLYRVLRRDGGKDRPMAGVYTLSVQLDRPPRLRILEPAATAVELPPGGPVRFSSRFEVSDDHGLGAVELRASVASGSGEGVKFRERRFELVREDGDDSVRATYRLDWDLEALGMAPGEEVYFFAAAADNREPEPNRARSDTVVVRWLDEAPEAERGDALGIDWMPAYFKSQRQIVIETERLIADEELLDGESFTRTSRALGQDQGDLKLRYGQYLGDEFEGWEAGAGDGGDASTSDTAEHDHAAEDHDDPHPGEHGHDAPGAASSAPGEAAAVIARFMHDHGSADIGPITERNPVGLMKRALANMWQAELHLLMAEPGRALPYEQDALKYLEMARQAERIYTRRLGFEPPPVSEQARLSGELEEASGWSRAEPGAPRDDDGALFGALYETLSRNPAAGATTPPDPALLERARDRLLRLAQERPALLQHAATLERLLGEGAEAARDCPDCLQRLRRLAWTLVPDAVQMPGPGARTLTSDDELARAAAGLDDPDSVEGTP